MRRRFRDEGEAPGQDAFLDIVANLVGILIILVMVVGVRAKGAWIATSQSEEAVDPETLPDVESAQNHFSSMERNVQSVERQLDRMQRTMDGKQRERDEINLLVQTIEAKLESKKEELAAETQEQLNLKSHVRLVSAQIEDMRRKTRSIGLNEKTPIELEHLPSPLAKTVFGKEVHFRLQNGRILYVPLNELTDQLRNEIQKKLWKLKDRSQITETIGPIQGFHLKYVLRRRTISQDTSQGPIVRQMAELARFTLIPVSGELGEPFEDALRESSQFRQIMASLRPDSTVVTAWTYPDSYGQFRHLKSWLFDRGFATAARPLPDGQPISGSPAGSRSAAQ